MTGTPENRMGRIVKSQPIGFDPELQMYMFPSILDPNKLLEARARARRDPDGDGYYGKPTGDYVVLVYSWLKGTAEDRKGKNSGDYFQARLKGYQARTELLLSA